MKYLGIASMYCQRCKETTEFGVFETETAGTRAWCRQLVVVRKVIDAKPCGWSPSSELTNAMLRARAIEAQDLRPFELEPQTML